MAPTIRINTDGGARGNPGPAAAGAVCREGDHILFSLKRYLGDRLTNNWAEYEALILALEEAKRFGLAERDLEVRMDSELVVKQMRREYRVKDPALKEQFARVQALLASYASVRFVHVPRAENKDADRLVNEALDEAA